MSRKHALRWLAVGVVLIAACVIALWPRGGDDDEPRPDAGPPPSLIPTTSAPAPHADGRLPCPASGDRGSGPLRGVHVTCLGDGSDVDLGAALAGRTTVLNVWAPWCAPCREELPALAEYAKRRGAADVLLMQVDSERGQGRALLDQLHVRLPTVFDTGAANKALHVPFGLPASYIVTADGKTHFVSDPRVFGTPESVADTVARYRGQ